VLGQEKVEDKSNEINAIPALLELLTIKGAIITIDAMGCQKNIAGLIREKQADYVLALKGNHGDMKDDIETFFEQENLHDKKYLIAIDPSIKAMEEQKYALVGRHRA
jgi:predicted transposase YbfD/YdcC